MFATEAVTGGLPVHIAARILGHKTLTTTQAYLAVFQDDLVRTYRGFLDRRRAERPQEEYASRSRRSRTTSSSASSSARTPSAPAGALTAPPASLHPLPRSPCPVSHSVVTEGGRRRTGCRALTPCRQCLAEVSA
ncbi:hypothetical protein [Streptomyces phaeoluteigriseus]|uniref:hypothetical protein n=1 Tax=Streptomyces phaeoluteigriseus TaxID=114686 RepID=UPI000B003D74|nr:hypothetical protein [Streptomyces phaeoluteigriseus]